MEYIRNDSVIVTNASGVISPKIPKAELVDISIYNFDAAATISITISDSQAAVANQGIVIPPGGVVFFSKSAGYHVPQAAFNAISSAASAVPNVAIYARWVS